MELITGHDYIADVPVSRTLAGAGVVHDGNPVMTWMLGNVVAYEDAKLNIMPDKRRSSEKIDGIAALIVLQV